MNSSEVRDVFSIDVRNSLTDAVADMFHVLQSEVPEEINDDLYREMWVFDQIWKEVREAVSKGQAHYIKDAVEPDEYARPVRVINDNERNYRANQ